MPQPQILPRRNKAPQQQILTKPASINGVERMNMIIIYLNQQTEFVPPQDLYVIEVDYGNRNCYNCRDFRYLVRNCRNRRTEDRMKEERRLEYKKNKNGERRIIEGENRQNNNLNGNRDLIVLDQISVIKTDL